MRETVAKAAGVFAVAPCRWGQVLVAASVQGVCCVLLGDSAAVLEADLRARFASQAWQHVQAQEHPWLAQVVAYLDAVQPAPAPLAVLKGVPLEVRGTPFRQRVWQALQSIPMGQVVSYAQLAQQLGQPTAARAVAAACAANPIAVLVPCHRVVRSDGQLAGYRWGLARKQALLAWEGVQLPAASAS